MIDFSSEKYTVSTGHTGTLGTSREDTLRMPMGKLELATLGYKPSALAIELNSSESSAGKELSCNTPSR